MPISYTDQQIRDQAEHLGLVQPGDDLPRHLRSKVVASLVADRTAAEAAESSPAVLAGQITIQPGGDIRIDGVSFPWLIARDRMEVVLNPDGVSTVRLTILADTVRVIDPPTTKDENRA